MHPVAQPTLNVTILFSQHVLPRCTLNAQLMRFGQGHMPEPCSHHLLCFQEKLEVAFLFNLDSALTCCLAVSTAYAVVSPEYNLLNCFVIPHQFTCQVGCRHCVGLQQPMVRD